MLLIFFSRPLALNDILKILENNNDDLSGQYADIEPQETIVYVTPPVDGDITDEDSDGKNAEPIQTRKTSIIK